MSVSDPTPISRRAAMRAWVVQTAPLLLLAACGEPPAGTPTSAPATQAPAAASPAASPMASPAASPAASPKAAVAASPSPQAGASPVAGVGCVLTPQQTEGPYYIDTDLVRGDITEGKPGLPLQLTLAVQRASTCQPIADATVEIWHCDALGEYSGFAAALPQTQGEPAGSSSGTPAAKDKPAGQPPGGSPGGQQQPTNTLRFLRGGQVSGADGRVIFQTVYPGWYMGRTVHIHVKVHAGGREVHTGQLYFEDAISNVVYMQQPYAAHTGRDTTNATDGIFRQGGQQSLLTLNQSGGGYTGTQTLVVQV
jgi:protocatechuate 3,4-dioxygenase beta subunit